MWVSGSELPSISPITRCLSPHRVWSDLDMKPAYIFFVIQTNGRPASSYDHAGKLWELSWGMAGNLRAGVQVSCHIPAQKSCNQSQCSIVYFGFTSLQSLPTIAIQKNNSLSYTQDSVLLVCPPRPQSLGASWPSSLKILSASFQHPVPPWSAVGRVHFLCRVCVCVGGGRA